MEQNLIDDDIFEYDPIITKVVEDHVPFSEFKDLIDPVQLRTELEKRSIDARIEKNRMTYNVIISQARMNSIREFATKKCSKFPGKDTVYFNAVKGAMGETAIVIILRTFLEIFDLDPALAKVNLRIHPNNDGGKDHLIGGVRMNSKFSNSPHSGMFFSERDLEKKDDSDYYILVNGENISDSQLKNEDCGSFPVTISGVVHRKNLVSSRMSSVRNRQGRERFIYEKNNLESLNVMIRDVLDRLNVKSKI